MSEDTPLARLSQRVGIEPSYWDVTGNCHHTSDDTRRAFLAAMGHPADTDEQAQTSLAAIEARPWQRMVEPVTVLRTSQPAAVQLVVPENQADAELRWSLTLEHGQSLKGRVRLGDLAVGEQRFDQQRVTLPLPGDLSLGYHRVRLKLGTLRAEGALIMTPPASYRPAWLDENSGRTWGIACQLYGLREPSNWGLGDLSDLARLCAKTAEMGGGAIGLPPLHALFPTQPQRLSPYSPSSRLFLNPNYIDVTAVPGIKACDDARTQALRATDVVDFAAVAALKRDVLHDLFEGFKDPDFDAFVLEGGEPLLRFAEFEALQEYLAPLALHDWPPAFRDPASQDTKTFAREHQDRVRFHMYLQWLADRQLAEAAAICTQSGMTIGLYRDLAVGVAPDGADAWLDPEAFVDGVRFGAPPDPLGPAGQDWGMPPFNPDALYERAYGPYVDMLRANMRHAGAVRIDHAMWLQQMFWIPPGGDGRNGAYVRYPLNDLLAILALESQRNHCLVIGETLGTVPEGFCDRLAHENILSYCLLQFERHPDGLYKRPDAYPALALATPASHDLPTLAGFWRETDIGVQQSIGLIESGESAAEHSATRSHHRAQLIAALVDQGLLAPDFPNTADISDADMATVIAAIHRFLARSPAALMMVNLEDALASTAQVNVPGTVDEYPNWRLKLPVEIEQIFAACSFKDINMERAAR